MDRLRRLVLVRACFCRQRGNSLASLPSADMRAGDTARQPLLANGSPFLARRRPFLAPDCAFVAQHGIQATAPSYRPGEDR
jgi:hypothetical protein